MGRLSTGILEFFQEQGCVIVSTVDREGFPSSSCKGIVEINKKGRFYLLDLYMGRTYHNLKTNPHVSITAINEHKFTGYCLKGQAKIILAEEIPAHLFKAWEDKITGRLTQRVLKNIREEKGHSRHPEILLPRPAYMIAVDVQEAIDLTPRNLK